jgi:Asp-tRNA(Asn)/Glu-tRNA(Gln) amidotransferase C subunit
MEDNVVLKRGLLLVLALMLQLSLAAQTTPLTCVDLCKPPDTGADSIVVDASTSTQLIRKFPQATGVEFLIKNKNPFKYEYRTEIVGRPLAEAIAFDFLTKAAGVNLTAGLVPLAGATSCDDPKFLALKATIESARTTANQMEPDLKTRVEAAAKVDAFLKETDKDKIDCFVMCPKARDLRPEIDKVVADIAQAEALLKEIEKAESQVGPAETSIAAITDVDDRNECLQDIGKEKDKLAKLKELSKIVQDLKNAQAPAKQLGTIIDSLKSTSFNEVQRRDVGETSYDFSLFRRDLRKKDAEEEKIAAVTADVGTSPISISGGIGFTTIEDVTIVAQTAVDPADSTKTISVFAEENASSFKPTPVVMLNANLSGPYNWGSARMQFSWSLGVALATRNDTTQTEYLTGPSFSFLDNRVLFTFAYHAARVAKLGGGFRIGQQIPAPLLQNLPVVNKWDNGFMFAVSYRIR